MRVRLLGASGSGGNGRAPERDTLMIDDLRNRIDFSIDLFNFSSLAWSPLAGTALAMEQRDSERKTPGTPFAFVVSSWKRA